MGIDDLIRILLFGAFLWPFVSGLFKKRQPPQGKNAPRRPSSSDRQPPEARPGRTRPSTTVAETQPASSFDKRLQEARRRVREAMETGEVVTPSNPTPEKRGLFKEPAEGTLLESPRSANRPQQRPSQRPSQQRPVQKRSSHPTQARPSQQSVQTLESAPRTFAPSDKASKTSFGEESDPLKVTRLRRKRTSSKRSSSRRSSNQAKRTTQAAPLLGLDKRSILRGFVWKQILDEPKAKQRQAQTQKRRTP